MNSKFSSLIFVVVLGILDGALGHGNMIDPLNRGSLWRLDSSKAIDYNDLDAACGGKTFQFTQMGGKCGLCGDKYSDAMPRPHELGGKYGVGDIMGTYTRGSTMVVHVKVVSNHMGHFTFAICNVDQEEESDACFERHKLYLASGEEIFRVPRGIIGVFKIPLKIPSDLKCNHCVLQWTYRAANNWGECPDGPAKVGCGPQEHFRGCSDIKIVSG